VADSTGPGGADSPDGADSPHGRAVDPYAAIVAELRARFGDAPAGAAVAIYLAARGYDAPRVTAVLARLAESSAAAPGVQSADAERTGVAPMAAGVAGVDAAGADPGGAPAPPARAVRAWAPHERARFTAEAWGRLLQLRAAGLGDAEFEHLIDRALLQLDGPVTLPELRALLGDALGSGDTDDPPTLH
jgi:hypothetical protein